MKRILFLVTLGMMFLSSCSLVYAQDIDTIPANNAKFFSDTLTATVDTVDVAFSFPAAYYTISVYTTSGADTINVYTKYDVWSQHSVIDLLTGQSASNIIIGTTPKEFVVVDPQPLKIRLVTPDVSASAVFTIREKTGSLPGIQPPINVLVSGGITDSIDTRIRTVVALDTFAQHRTDLARIDSLRDVDGAAQDSIGVLRGDATAHQDSILQHRDDLTARLDSILQHRTDITALVDSILQHRSDITALLDSILAHTSLYASFVTTSTGITRVDSISRTGQNASISTADFSTSTNGFYRVSYYIYTETADDTAGTVALSIGWNDGASARVVASDSVSFQTGVGVSIRSGTVVMYNGDGNEPTWSTTVNGNAYTGKYAVIITRERLF